MLSKEEKQSIRNLQTYHCSTKEIKGKPVTDHKEPFVIPSYPELLAKAISDIKALGYKDVTRVSPNKANCIVRIYSTTHYEYDDVLTYNIFGTIFYAKENCVWTADFCGNIIPINYSSFETCRWLCQDEKITFKHDFADFYLHIS